MVLVGQLTIQMKRLKIYENLNTLGICGYLWGASSLSLFLLHPFPALPLTSCLL